MAVTIIDGKQLTPAPEGADVFPVVFDNDTGQYHKGETTAGSGETPAELKDEDFSFEALQDTVIEYLTFRKNQPLNITIGTTPGGAQIYAGQVDNPGPINLFYYVDQNKTIYVGGIVPGTIVKKKIS